MDIEKALALSEGAVDAEQNKYSSLKPEQRCLNCNTVLTDSYCPHCGQKDIPARQTLVELLQNFISSFWSFESKFLKTGGYIFLKPGLLAKDYTEGKRERYFHPARMYVFISFVYFLLIGTLPDPPEEANKKGKNNVNITGWEFGKSFGNYTSFAQYDSAQKTLAQEERDGKFKRMIMKRIAEINDKYKDKGTDFVRDFGENFFANTPKIFFLLLPVFALLLKILYIRRDYFYSEHLVFTIYYYNFFFLAGSIYMIFNQIPVVENIVGFIGLWIFLYLLFAMKKMYGQSWRKTIFKFCTFVFCFSFCTALGLLGNAIFTFLIL
jgi:hypothetical protein